jgi:hypothetical protein
MGTLREDGLMSGESNICMRIHYQIFYSKYVSWGLSSFVQTFWSKKFWDKMK